VTDKKVILKPEIIGYLKKHQQYTDEQIESLTPACRRILNAALKFESYNMIAEVVWACHCAHQSKPGDKYVFRVSSRLVPEESTFKASCLWALSRFLPFIQAAYERLAEGIEDLSPKGWDHVKCADP